MARSGPPPHGAARNAAALHPDPRRGIHGGLSVQPGLPTDPGRLLQTADDRLVRSADLAVRPGRRADPLVEQQGRESESLPRDHRQHDEPRNALPRLGIHRRQPLPRHRRDPRRQHAQEPLPGRQQLFPHPLLRHRNGQSRHAEGRTGLFADFGLVEGPELGSLRIHDVLPLHAAP